MEEGGMEGGMEEGGMEEVGMEEVGMEEVGMEGGAKGGMEGGEKVTSDTRPHALQDCKGGCGPKGVCKHCHIEVPLFVTLPQVNTVQARLWGAHGSTQQPKLCGRLLGQLHNCRGPATAQHRSKQRILVGAGGQAPDICTQCIKWGGQQGKVRAGRGGWGGVGVGVSWRSLKVEGHVLGCVCVWGGWGAGAALTALSKMVAEAACATTHLPPTPASRRHLHAWRPWLETRRRCDFRRVPRPCFGPGLVGLRPAHCTHYDVSSQTNNPGGTTRVRV
jgi:hypothetical protein